MANILRLKETWKKVGVGKTKFDEDYRYHEGGDEFIPGTQIPRLKAVKLGERAIGFFDDEVDAVNEGLRAEREAALKPTTRRNTAAAKEAAA
jgi:predicted DNA-binding transcriptional regulator AlpA